MVINARLREFLHEHGHLERFIKNAEAYPCAPQVITTIAEAFVWAYTPEGMDFWLFLDYTFAKESARYTINEPKKYQGDDDSRTE